MTRITYNKLVRDGIKDKIEAKGERCEIREITDNEEFKQALFKKVTEEAEELSRAHARDSFLQEYADLMVALDALTALYEFSEADIKTAITENVSKKGFFKNRHFLVWSEHND